MDWTVIAYGSGDFLRMVFNAIASVFGNSDYKMAMLTVAMMGLFAFIFRAAFDRNIMGSFRWLIGVIVLLFALLVPKVNVVVDDKLNPSNSAAINNIPIGLAVTASFFSFTGDWLTRTFEAVFSMPGEVQYSNNGLLFAHSLYEAVRTMNFHDDRLNQNFSEFFSSCVVIDGVGHGRFTWNDVLAADNLIAFFETKVAVNAAAFKYIDSAGAESILQCRPGFTNALKPDLIADYSSIIENGLPGGFISRFGGFADAKNKVTTDLPNVMSYLTGVSQTAQSIVVQNAITNAMAKGVHKLAAQTDSVAQASYIQSGAELHRLTTFNALGKIASEKLPLLRIIFEAVIYAIFPIIVLMAIVLPGKVPFAYLTALVWINLWAPMYAILHFIMSYYTHQVNLGYMGLYGNGFSVMANSAMDKVNSDIVATTGYLAASLPMLAWMLVSRSGAMAASLAGRLMQGYDKSVEGGADEIVKGQGQRMGTKWEQTGAGGIQNTVLTDSGSRLTEHVDGRQTIQQATSHLVVDAKATQSMVQTEQQSYENSVTSQEAAQAKLAQSTSDLLSSIKAVATQTSSTSGGSESFRSADVVQRQENLAKIKNAVEEWAKSMGHDVNSAFTKSVFAAAQAHLGGSIPLIGGATVSAGGKAEGSHSEVSKESLNLVNRFMESNQFSTALQSIASSSSEQAGVFGVSDNDSTMSQLSANLASQKAASKEYLNTVQQTESAKESLGAALQLSTAFSVDNGQVIFESLMNHLGDHKKVENILLKAQKGDQEAIYTIQQSLIETNEMYDMSLNPNFRKVMDVMFNEEKNNIGVHHELNVGSVVTQHGDSQDKVSDREVVSLGAGNESAINIAVDAVAQSNSVGQDLNKAEQKSDENNYVKSEVNETFNPSGAPPGSIGESNYYLEDGDLHPNSLKQGGPVVRQSSTLNNDDAQKILKAAGEK